MQWANALLQRRNVREGLRAFGVARGVQHTQLAHDDRLLVGQSLQSGQLQFLEHQWAELPGQQPRVRLWWGEHVRWTRGHWHVHVDHRLPRRLGRLLRRKQSRQHQHGRKDLHGQRNGEWLQRQFHARGVLVHPRGGHHWQRYAVVLWRKCARFDDRRAQCVVSFRPTKLDRQPQSACTVWGFR
jgi:hypothetical protein